MTELDGTELFTRITERLTDDTMSERLAKAMAVFVGHGEHDRDTTKGKGVRDSRQHRGVRTSETMYNS